MDNLENQNQIPTNKDTQDPTDIIGETLVNLLSLAQMLQNISPQNKKHEKPSHQEPTLLTNNNYSETQQMAVGHSNYFPQEQCVSRDAPSVARTTERMHPTQASSSRTLQPSLVKNDRCSTGNGNQSNKSGHQARRKDHHPKKKSQLGTRDSTVNHPADHQRHRTSDSRGLQSDTHGRTFTKASDMPGVKNYNSSSEHRGTQSGAKPFKRQASRDKPESAVRHFKVAGYRTQKSKASATQSSSRSNSQSQHVNIDRKLDDRSEPPIASTQDTFLKDDRQTPDSEMLDTGQLQTHTTGKTHSQPNHPSKTISKKEKNSSLLKDQQSNTQPFTKEDNANMEHCHSLTKPQHTKQKVGVSKSSAAKNNDSSESINPQTSSGATCVEETMSLSSGSNSSKDSRRSTRYPPGIEKTIKTIANKLTTREGVDFSSSKEKQVKSKMKETTKANVSLSDLISETKPDSVSKTPQKEKRSLRCHTQQKNSHRKDLQKVRKEAKSSYTRRVTADDRKHKKVQKTGFDSKDILNEPLKPFTFGNSSISERRFSLEDIVSQNEQHEKMDDKMNDNQSCLQSNDQSQTSPVMKSGLDEDLPILVRSRRRSEKQRHSSAMQGNIQTSPKEKSPPKIKDRGNENNNSTPKDNSDKNCSADFIPTKNKTAEKQVFENNINKAMEEKKIVDGAHENQDTDTMVTNEGLLRKENSSDSSPTTVRCKFLNFLPLAQNVKDNSTPESGPSCSNVLEMVESRDTVSSDKDSEVISKEVKKSASGQSDNPTQDWERHVSANKTDEISAKVSNEIIIQTLRNLKREPEWNMNDNTLSDSSTKNPTDFGGDGVNNTEDSSRNVWNDLQLGEKAVSSANELVKIPATEGKTKQKSIEEQAKKMEKENFVGARKTWHELLNPQQEHFLTESKEIPLILTTIKTEPVSPPISSDGLFQHPQYFREPEPQQSELTAQRVLKQEQLDDKTNDIPDEKSAASPFQQKQLENTPNIKEKPTRTQHMINGSKQTDAVKPSILQKKLINRDSVDTVEVSCQDLTTETRNNSHTPEAEVSRTVGNISKLPEITENVNQQPLTCDKAMNKETIRSKPAISPIRYISDTPAQELTLQQTTVESNTSKNSISNTGAEGSPVESGAQKLDSTVKQMESKKSMDSQCEKVKPAIKKSASSKRTVILTDSFLPPKQSVAPYDETSLKIDSTRKSMNNNGTREREPTNVDSNEKSQNNKTIPEVKSDVKKLTLKSSVKPNARENKEISSVVSVVKERKKTNLRQTREQSVARQIVRKSIGIRATPARSIKSKTKLTAPRKSNKENNADDIRNSSHKDRLQKEQNLKKRMQHDPNTRKYEPHSPIESQYIERGNERSSDSSSKYENQGERNYSKYFNRNREYSSDYGYERSNRPYDHDRSRGSRNSSRDYSFNNEPWVSPTQSSSSWDRDSCNSYGHSYWRGNSYHSRSPSPSNRWESPRNRSLTPPNRYTKRSRSPISRSRSPPSISSHQRSRSPAYRTQHHRSDPDRYRSTCRRSESPYNRPRSSNARSSPYRHKSPYRRMNSPLYRSRSPYHKSSSPYCRSRSSPKQSESPCLRQKSPNCRSQSPKNVPDLTKTTTCIDQSAETTWWKNYTAKTVEENFREITKSGSKPRSLSHDKSNRNNEPTILGKSHKPQSVTGKEKPNEEKTNAQTKPSSPVICVSNLIQIPTTLFEENKGSINNLPQSVTDIPVNKGDILCKEVEKSKLKENKNPEQDKSSERQKTMKDNKKEDRDKDRPNKTNLNELNNAKESRGKLSNKSMKCVQIEESSSEQTGGKKMVENESLKEDKNSTTAAKKTMDNRSRSSSAIFSQNEHGKQNKKDLTSHQIVEENALSISLSKNEEEKDRYADKNIKESGKSDIHHGTPVKKTEDNAMQKTFEKCEHPATISKYVDINLKNMTHIYTSDGEQVCNSFNMSKFTNIGCPGTCGHLHLSLPLYDPLTKTNMSVPQTDEIEVLRDKRGFAFFFNMSQKMICNNFNSEDGCKNNNCMMTHTSFYETFSSYFERKLKYKTASAKNRQHSTNNDKTYSSQEPKKQTDEKRKSKPTMPRKKPDKEPLDVDTSSPILIEEDSGDNDQTKETGTKEFPIVISPLKPKTSNDKIPNSGNYEVQTLFKYKAQERDQKLEANERTCIPKLPNSAETEDDPVPVVKKMPPRKPCRYFNTRRGCMRMNCPFRHIPSLVTKTSTKSLPQKQLITKTLPQKFKSKWEESRKDTAAVEHLVACLEKNCNIKSPGKSPLSIKQKKFQKSGIISDKTNAMGLKKQSENKIQRKDEKSKSKTTPETNDEKFSSLDYSNEKTLKSSENIGSTEGDSTSGHKLRKSTPDLPTPCTKDTENSNLSPSKVIENPDLPASKKRKLQPSPMYTRPKRSRGYRGSSWGNDYPTRQSRHEASDFYHSHYHSNRLPVYWRLGYTENVGLSHFYPGFEDPWDHPHPQHDRHYVYDYSEDVQF